MVALSADTLSKMIKNKNKKDLLLIHGAWSSKTIFNYLSDKLEQKCKSLGDVYHGEYCINSCSVDVISSRLYHTLELAKRDVVIVAHSMGGLLALDLECHPKVASIITVASPLDGLDLHKFIQMFLTYRSPNMADVLRMSNYVNKIQNKEYTKPIKCVITTEGYNPAWYEKSDGVVTINSQKRWTPPNATLHYMQYNHHEIVQSPELFELVKGEIEQ